MATTKTAKKTTAPTAPATPAAAGTLRIMDVAERLKVRYQKARDLMLRGDLGPTSRDASGKLTVTLEGVEAYRAKTQPA
jgi:hypothetical protein